MFRNQVPTADKLKVHGILIGIEVGPDTNIEAILNLVADTLMLTDGVGAVECEHLGEIETLSEDAEQPSLPGLEEAEVQEIKH